MKRKLIQLLSGTCSALIIFLLFGILNFFEVTDGNVYTDPEAVDGRQFYLGLVSIVLIIFLIYKLTRAGYKYVAMGLSIVLFILIPGTVKTGLTYFDKTNYYKEFDSTLWTKSDNTGKLKMARSLTKQNKFIGFHKNSVIDELGAPYNSTNDEITYDLGGGILYKLTFKIKNEKVVGSMIAYKD